MAESFKELLAGTNDRALLSAAFDLVVRHYGDDFDVSKLRPVECNLLLAYQAWGIIGNGGFNYLFEGNFKGDPEFALTAEAYRAIGCAEAAEAFQEALDLFPGGRPPTDIEERLKRYRKGRGDGRGKIDDRFFEADGAIERCLASYIRSHREVFERLENAPRARRAKRKPARPAKAKPERKIVESVRAAVGAMIRYITGEAKRERSVSDVLADLPHWARVAFAARCGRRVLPLFSKNWPNAEPKRRTAILTAIRLVEGSAEEGRALDALEDAETNALVTAGAALRGLYGFPDDKEPPPDDGNRATAASFIAKAAEFAVRAARSAPKESALAALQAFTFARDAASGDEALLDPILDDLARLHRAAAEGRWRDRTPVPADFWDTI
jgi:Domain of unknown function (DUF4375)